MSIEGRAPRLAVLIDAENASPKIAEALFTEIAALGEASARRIYGDFASPQIAGWTKVLARFAIQPQQNFANTKGKNSGDIALVIDAMDLLHSGRFDGFCLVSSDADFTRLASRIREEGVDVYGFGEQKTPESFRQACTRFIYTENLSLPGEGDADPSRTVRRSSDSKRRPAEAARLTNQFGHHEVEGAFGAPGGQGHGCVMSCLRSAVNVRSWRFQPNALQLAKLRLSRPVSPRCGFIL